MRTKMYYEKADRLLYKAWLRVLNKCSDQNYSRVKKLCDLCIEGQRLGYLPQPQPQPTE